MKTKKREILSNVINELMNPRLFYRWIRRYGLWKLGKQIERLPSEVEKAGKRYFKLPNTLVIY